MFDNVLILDEDNRIVFMGPFVYGICDPRKSGNTLYPEGKLSLGDCAVYLTNDLSRALKAGEILGINIDPGEDVKNVIIVAAINNEDVSPVIKYNADTISFAFERKWVSVEALSDRIDISFDDEYVTRPPGAGNEVLEFMAVAGSDGSIKYFSPYDCDDCLNVLESGIFEAYGRTGGITGRNASELINDALLEKICSLRNGERICIEVNAGHFVLQRETSDDPAGHAVYTVYDEQLIVDRIISANMCYSDLNDAELSKHKEIIKLNSFRLWGNSKKLRETENLLQKGSVTNATILLTGESGTGKSFLAREIHNMSMRKNKPFVHVNCAAIPYNLLESELFGYEEGAFTGARRGGKEGLFERAYGGTLFLDEITEIPLTLQGKLLEVLQNKTFYRVGGTRKLSVDVRLVAATNRDLKKLVYDKDFREDLYYRINVFPIEIPPLRERMDTLQNIVGDLLMEIFEEINVEPVIMSYQALEKLKTYDWPGNIRELQNTLQRAVILCNQKAILPEDITIPEKDTFNDETMTLKEAQIIAEKDAICKALKISRGDKDKSAVLLGISRSSLFDKIRKYNISDGDKGYDFREH